MFEKKSKNRLQSTYRTFKSKSFYFASIRNLNIFVFHKPLSVVLTESEKAFLDKVIVSKATNIVD